jgi:6-pyruvoyltetrahydropterin/6-carboxytetrahydropterin synthase
MYTLAVRRDFIAQHYLIGGEWGPENELHSHHYQVEVELSGDQLDQHGYLVDIVEVEQQLEAQITRFRDKTLNELDEFRSVNPSLEHFARIFCQALVSALPESTLHSVTVRLWENEIAWASYRWTLRD